MKQEEKIRILKDDHLPEWRQARRTTEYELSKNQKMFCVCGKLATGLHESSCLKFRLLVDKETLKKVKHLLLNTKK